MDCPKCGSNMQKRLGKHGEFMFCPMQYRCGQKTFSVPPTESPQPVLSFTENCVDLDLEFKALWGQAGDMARMAYENNREFERSHDHGSIDPAEVVFGGGPFVNGPYEDDEDAILW